MTVVLISCLDKPVYREWGLLAERIPQPFLNLPAATDLPSALAAGRAAFPEADRYCYADPEFLSEFFSFDLLYEGALHSWLDAVDVDPLVFRRIVLPGPPDLVCVTADTMAQVHDDMVATHEVELERWILSADARRKTFVFGDSHVWHLYTDLPRIGMRGVVVEALDVDGRQELKVCRHLGPFTMHRLAERGDLSAEMFHEYGLRSGDVVVAVCGEIDLRNHIGRIAAEWNVSRASLITDLCSRFCKRLESALQEFKPVDVVLSVPTPPLDFVAIGREDVEHVGSLEERIDSTQEMARCLKREAAARGWKIIDVTADFADERGALRAELSDLFCHVSHFHKAPALLALSRLMAAAPQ